MQMISMPRRSPLRYLAYYAVFALLVFVLFSMPINYIIYMPGNVYVLSEMIEVPDGHQSDGDFLMTVVLSQHANIPLFLRAVFIPENDIYPLAQVRPASLSEEEYQQQMLQSMLNSQEVATGLALRHCGYEVAEMSDGVRILGFTEGNRSEGILHAGDIIVACEDNAISVNTQLTALLRTRTPGEMVTLVILRGDRELRLHIELVPRLDDPQIGAIGVTVSNVNWRLELPLEINVLSEDIGGASAGLMMTLEIINQLSNDDLAAGMRIAGTGTVDLYGNVGAIGGIRQKVLGALHNGADYFLAPRANYQEALSAAGDRIPVIEIGSLEAALVFLKGLK
ncbi:MAG: PDZ domain-containing protein [Symbiobacteriaceae bacterium]|nr:PDZ domain-containing protein [Symbiobacteriaceae bacterium]